MLFKFSMAAAALSLGLAAGPAEAGPVPAQPSLRAAAGAPVQTVQAWYYDDDYEVPPPRRYYQPPAYGYYNPPPRYGYYGPPRYGYYGPRRHYYYDRDAAKDYVKDYRRAQKDAFKDRVRAWNRTHGF
jgi:hypothetical protein